jgi:hypothetical protein
MTDAREFTKHLAELLRKERGVMTDFILALADFDRKELWRELGHTSLFYFLHRELKLSKGAAYNRKVAADLVQAFPAVEAALRSGQLCMSTVIEVARVLTPENCEDVLPRFFGLSHQEAKDVSASLRPAPVIPLRDVVTAIRPAAPALEPMAEQAVHPAAPAGRTVHATALPLATPAVSSAASLVHVHEPDSRAAALAPASLPPAAPACRSVEPALHGPAKVVPNVRWSCFLECGGDSGERVRRTTVRRASTRGAPPRARHDLARLTHPPLAGRSRRTGHGTRHRSAGGAPSRASSEPNERRSRPHFTRSSAGLVMHPLAEPAGPSRAPQLGSVAPGVALLRPRTEPRLHSRHSCTSSRRVPRGRRARSAPSSWPPACAT